MEVLGRYCLLHIHEGDVYCADYTDRLDIAQAWKSDPSVKNCRWYEEINSEEILEDYATA